MHSIDDPGEERNAATASLKLGLSGVAAICLAVGVTCVSGCIPGAHDFAGPPSANETLINVVWIIESAIMACGIGALVYRKPESRRWCWWQHKAAVIGIVAIGTTACSMIVLVHTILYHVFG